MGDVKCELELELFLTSIYPHAKQSTSVFYSPRPRLNEATASQEYLRLGGVKDMSYRLGHGLYNQRARVCYKICCDIKCNPFSSVWNTLVIEASCTVQLFILFTYLFALS